MSEGALFVRLYYPGYIGLEKGIYRDEIQGRLSSVRLIDHLRPLQILDFDNRIRIRQEESKFNFEIANKDWSIGEPTLAVMHESELLCLMHSRSGHHRLFHPRTFTDMIIAYEIETAPDFTEDDLAFHERVLSPFINKYRCITNDVKIILKNKLRKDVPVVLVAVVVYDEDDLKLDRDERLHKKRLLAFRPKQISVREFGHELPRVEHNLQKASEQMTQLRFSRDQIALVDAFEELTINKNPRAALLSAIIIAEVMLGGYLHELKLKRGASKSKLDDFENEVPFSYILNVELPVLLGNPTDSDREVIGKMDQVRKKRNAVIHKGEETSEGDALEALNAVKGLRDLLAKHPL
jgi:hypothetical protein